MAKEKSALWYYFPTLLCAVIIYHMLGTISFRFYNFVSTLYPRMFIEYYTTTKMDSSLKELLTACCVIVTLSVHPTSRYPVQWQSILYSWQHLSSGCSDFACRLRRKSWSFFNRATETSCEATSPIFAPGKSPRSEGQVQPARHQPNVADRNGRPRGDHRRKKDSDQKKRL